MGAYDGSFARFYESHVSRVAIFLYKHGATLDDAWDATQSAFVKLLQNWDAVRTPNAWVRKTAGTEQEGRVTRPSSHAVREAWCRKVQGQPGQPGRVSTSTSPTSARP